MGANSLKRRRSQAPTKEPENSGGAGTEASGKPAKRARSSADFQLLKLYSDLAAESDETRLVAAKQIVVHFSPENQPSKESVEKALDKLIRGLCSSRKAARYGFFVTLTELLGMWFRGQGNGLEVGVEGLIGWVVEKTKVEGNVLGQDRRDHSIGRLFGFKAIMQSKILIEPELHLDAWKKVLDHIYTMARDIPWLREECGLVVVDAVKSLGSQASFRDCAREGIERLISFNLAKTPEGVAIWLTVKAQFEDVLPENVWNDKDPLSKSERTQLARILKEDFRSATENGKNGNIKSGSANPNPIFAWDLVLSETLRRDLAKSQSKHGAKSEFPQFWLDTVDNNLFSSTASHVRKSWGFKLFATLIKAIAEDQIPALFSPNLMRSLINQSKKEDRLLHAAALSAHKAMVARVQQTPTSALPIVVALTGKSGAVDIDRTTKTKTLQTVILSADDDTLRKIVRHLRTLILRPDTQEQAIADSRRQCIADILLTIVREYPRYGPDFVSGEEHDNWLRNILEVLVEHAYFIPRSDAKTSKVPLPAVSESTRKVFQERVSSCLTRLLGLESESRASFALMTVGMIREKASSSKALELVFKADKPILKNIDKAFKTVDTLRAKGSISGRKAAAEGLILLYSLALLQVYEGNGDAVLLLDDLDSSYKALSKKKDESSSKPEGQDPFVEILLTFLGNPRTLFKKIAEEAFAIFASDLREDGLRSLTDILDTPENLEGQNQLFNQGGEEEEAGSDAEMEDVEEASDVEMVDGKLVRSGEADGEASDVGSDDGSDEEAETTSTDSDSDDSDDSDVDDRDDEELARFDDLLAQTLKTSKPTLDGGASDDTSDEDMDDEQMMALDPHLTKIFQERRKITSKKGERKDAKQTVVQFKSRVLDLLAIFMEKQYSNPLTLTVILPLLRRIRAGGNKQLMNKSYGILKTYTTARSHHKAPSQSIDKSSGILKTDTAARSHHKAPLPKPENVDEAWEILQAVHDEAKLGGEATLHVNACASASIHIAKVLVGLDRENYAKVVDVYAETQKEWFAEKTRVQPVLFTQFLNWSISLKRGN
ncbi:uncharacterized protein EI97DRAFT_387372 [Westerdykella ornata]|uniref:DNA polymerase V n=1 Tax=Westerdykella ornata TaxID=318751 RepID=A0A6A6J6S5_WESOR|nr:uncharacterized protein EI97DRAFT_387372 [Westerdykella ornata]KAF2271678.1 hypothetical protein EI97DRAFT_387372 [Westerdykella ornata]